MKCWKSLLALAVISIWFPLFFLLRYESLLWGILLTLWVATVLWIGMRFIQRDSEIRQRAVIQSIERTAIKTLNHHRHDWMNDLQILYGYIQLGKHDKTVGCVGRIKERMEVESKIATLGIPSLVFYLQSFRTIGSNIELEVVVLNDLQLADRMRQEDSETWVSAIMQTIRAYQYSNLAPSGESRKLILTLYEEHGEVVAHFEGEGSQVDSEVLQKQIHNVVQSDRITTKQLQSSQASIQLRVPCDT
ncbi:MAG TPA: Spo0B domain-containing protein [Paenibacillus sp.]